MSLLLIPLNDENKPAAKFMDENLLNQVLKHDIYAENIETILQSDIYKMFIEKYSPQELKEIFEEFISDDLNEVKYVNTKLIKSMVDSFTITNEQFIENNYLAKINVS